MRIHRFEIGTSGVLFLVCRKMRILMLVIATPSLSASHILNLDCTIFDKLSPPEMRKVL